MAKIDPQVSCPIVCGEYMRATGFFFKADDQTYLITARHNLLPTDASTLATGQLSLSYRTDNFLPTIDIYLRDGPTFTVKRIDLTEQSGILIDASIDVIGVPIPFSPEDYGYVVWTLDDITPGSSPEMIDVIGYPGSSFPDPGTYDRKSYAQRISAPYILTLLDDFPTHREISSSASQITLGILTGVEDSTPDYRGYSGSPILGDDLAGIHCADIKIPGVNPETGEESLYPAIAFWEADVLEQLLISSGRMRKEDKYQ